MSLQFLDFIMLMAGCFIHLTIFAQISISLIPKEISLSTGEIITIYQPQPETFSGNKIYWSARHCLFRKKSNDEPIFGAVFY